MVIQDGSWTLMMMMMTDDVVLRLVNRTFFGTTTEETVSRQINLLWEILGVMGELRTDSYMVAVYENPGVPHRRNEIWFIRRNL